MFRNFTRTGDTPTAKVVPINGAGAAAVAPVVNLAASGGAAEQFVTDEERNLVKRLELKAKLHDAVLDRMNLNVIDKIDPEDLRREITTLVAQVVSSEGSPLSANEFKTIVDELLHEVLGLGPLEPLLADPTINDILINGYRSVYVERFGVLEKAPTRFRDEKHLLRIIDKIVSRVGRRIDESMPWVDARLEDGSRVNAIIRPCAIDGPSMSIRKFSKKPYTMDRLVDAGALSGRAAALLKGLVQARMNVIISGGTGSGKTTMLNAMSSFIDERERIVTIEDAAELQLQQAHVVRLETRPRPRWSRSARVHR